MQVGWPVLRQLYQVLHHGAFISMDEMHTKDWTYIYRELYAVRAHNG